MAHPPHSPATPNTAAHIRVSGVSASYGSHRVLTDISFSVTAGDPTGLIGENGSGKSTLLRIMAGLHAPDTGEVRAVGPDDSLRVGLLHQEPPFAPHDTVAQAVESAVRTVRDAASVVDRAADALARAPEERGRSHRVRRRPGHCRTDRRVGRGHPHRRHSGRARPGRRGS